MTMKAGKPWLFVGLGFAVVLGCTFTQLGDGGGNGSAGSGGGFAIVDSYFTEATPSSLGSAIEGGGGGAVDAPAGEETRSFFTAFQIDPTAEDSAGPKFVVSADMDQDGLLDLVSAWNQSQPVQLHLQRRDANGNISFRTISLGGTTPIGVVAGLEVGQINGDGFPDVVVLAKATGFATFCPPKNPGDPPTELGALDGEIIVLFNPGSAALIPDGDNWRQMILVNPFVADRWIHNQFPGNEFVSFEESKTKPESSGFTALAVGNVDGVPGDDIIVALNPAKCETLGQDPPVNTVDLWVNPGFASSENSALWGVPAPNGLSRGVPVTLMTDAPQVKDIVLMDADSDGDLDVVATYTNAISQNIRWARNPLIPHNTGGPSGFGAVIGGVVPGVDLCTGGTNDGGACPNGDGDCVGVADGACLGGHCAGGAFPGQDCVSGDNCLGVPDGVCTYGTWRYLATGWQERPIGQLDTAADVMATGDIDGDGFDDIVVRSTAGQIVQWFRRPNPLPIAPEFPPDNTTPDRFNFPWPVFTLTEFNQQEPEGISLGDVTGDGNPEVIVAAEGAVYWYDSSTAVTVYDPWSANAIIQDGPAETTDPSQASGTLVAGTGVGVAAVDISTNINTLLVVDLDGDGRNDIVGTLDRRSGTGLSDDRLVWYRNVRTDPAP